MAGFRSYRLKVVGCGYRPPPDLSLGDGVPRLVGEGRHDLAGKASDVLARAAEIDQDVFDPALLQILQLAGDLIRVAENRGFVAEAAHLARVIAGEAVALVAAGPARQIVDADMALVSSLQRGGEISLVAGDVHG